MSFSFKTLMVKSLLSMAISWFIHALVVMVSYRNMQLAEGLLISGFMGAIALLALAVFVFPLLKPAVRVFFPHYRVLFVLVSGFYGYFVMAVIAGLFTMDLASFVQMLVEPNFLTILAGTMALVWGISFVLLTIPRSMAESQTTTDY